jgi:tRNA(fMet)-specific endonuclease VapC
MKKILIDTCVIIHIVRESATGIKCLKTLAEFDDNPSLVVSVVTKAELESFSRQNNWGAAKVQQLTNFLNAAIVVDIMQADRRLFQKEISRTRWNTSK